MENFGVLDSDTVPEIIGYDYAVSRTHIKRLYEEEGNDLNKIVFLNADGSQTAYIYDYPVKYIDETGAIRDITLDIAENGSSGQFKTAAGASVTTFSRNITEGIRLTGNNESISLVPHLPTRASTAAASAASETDANTSIAQRIDSKTVSYAYDEKTAIEYSLTYTGFKEDIVVNEYTGQTEYDFTLYTNGLQLIEIDHSFYLANSANQIKAALGDIIIFTADGKNNAMGDIVARTVTENQEYLLTIVVDPEFLADENTAYPIRIDPTVEICYDNNGDGAIADVTINSNSASSGTSGSLYVGRRDTYGISRILMKFPGLNLNSLGNNITVTNASVRLRDLMCETAALDISCYVFSGNEWNETTADWSNVNPYSISTFLSSNTISYANGMQQSTAHWYTFDITAAVEGWRTGNYNQNKGILFKAPDSVENGTAHNRKLLASYNRSSYKPSLSVTYSTTSNLISDGTYYLNNRYSGNYLRYTSSAATASSGLISNLGDSIRWEIQAVNGGYMIRSKADSTKYLGVPTDTNNGAVSIVTVSDSAIPTRCIWTATVASGGGCYIKNTYNSRYLSSENGSLYTTGYSGVGSAGYDTGVWRVASTSYYGNTESNTRRELQSGFSIDPLVVDIGASRDPKINKSPSNSIWADASDFTYAFSSGTTGSVTFNKLTGGATGKKIGITNYTATHKVTGRMYVFTVYVDRYTYELTNFFGFETDVSILIRDLYNKINATYSSSTEKYKAWVASRVLSEFSYDDSTTYFLIISINKWDDVAGSVTSMENRKTYFVNTLGYTEAEYNKLNNALDAQHKNDKQTSDFTHMQYSLAARLAYRLNQDGVLSNIYTLSGNENVSYLAGWFGDATLTNNGTTSFGNDDYMADLDAENIFRMVDSGTSSISAFNEYYNTLAIGPKNRATIFKTHLSYSTVESKVLSELKKTLNDVKTSYPDTYDFLMSLKDDLAEIKHY